MKASLLWISRPPRVGGDLPAGVQVPGYTQVVQEPQALQSAEHPGGGVDLPAGVQVSGQLHCGPARHKLQSYIAGKLPIKKPCNYFALTCQIHG